MRWTYDHSCHSLDDIILEDVVVNLVQQYIEKKTFFNCTLAGHQGIGKTTLAKLIPTLIPGSDTLFINASSESGIDTIRTKVQDFTSSKGFGVIKFVILDEADKLSSDAQKSLRPLIEECADDTRFILTCNFIGSIIAPLLSRCIPLYISHNGNNKVKILKKLAVIMTKEKVTFTKDDLQIINKEIVERHFPDIRLMINHLETCCISGTFKIENFSDDSVSKDIAKTVIDSLIKQNIKDIRKYWLEKEGDFSRDYISLSREIFNLVDNDEKKMLVVADSLYKMSIVLDKEIQFTSMILQLKELSK